MICSADLNDPDKEKVLIDLSAPAAHKWGFADIYAIEPFPTDFSLLEIVEKLDKSVEKGKVVIRIDGPENKQIDVEISKDVSVKSSFRHEKRVKITLLSESVTGTIKGCYLDEPLITTFVGQY